MNGVEGMKTSEGEGESISKDEGYHQRRLMDMDNGRSM